MAETVLSTEAPGRGPFPPGGPAELSVEGLVKEFGGRRVLDGVGFAARSGEFVAVTGPSGCGKTTLLNLLGALDRPTAGRITLRPSTAPGSRRAINVGRLRGTAKRLYLRDVVGFVFQNAGLVDTWTVRQNLKVPITPAGRPAGAAAIADVLQRVGAGELERARVFTLSGGEQQRVALARLLLKDPVLVLADEPMAALDQANAEVVFQALAGLARRGALVLMCTHDPAVLGRCDRVWELPGRGAASGASVEAYDRADGGADGVPETVPEAGLEAAS